MPTLKGTETTIRVEPLKQWPKGYDRRDPDERISSRFEAPLNQTLGDLDDELRRIDAEGVVLQVDVENDEIRKSDGLPYMRAEVDPGVVLSFENDEGSHTYPADLYDQWADNLRAIFYTLHDLRRISRHGVGHGSEQYRGFTALPASVDDRLTPEDAARILAMTAPGLRDEHGGADAAVETILEDEATATRFYREAAKRSHPDRRDVVNDAHFKRVQTAAQILRQHHGG